MNNNELLSIIDSWQKSHDESIISRLDRLERQNSEIIHKESRILEKITLINGKLNTLLEECVNLQAVALRFDFSEIKNLHDIIDSNKAWKEGFDSAMKINNFEPGKDVCKTIYELMNKKFYDGR